MKKITLLISILLLFASAAVKAQTSISPEKQKAVKELIGLITQDNKAEDLIKAMTAQFDSMHDELVTASLVERTDLTVAERKSMEKVLIADMQKYRSQFQARLMEKLDYNTLIEEISIIVYDKYYTLPEINDLIAFYKTPTGQKSLKVMQPLMLDTMQLTQEKLTPKIITVMRELREEQKQIIAKRVNELKPRKKQ